MRKWKMDVELMEGLGEGHMLGLAARDMRLSEILCSLGVSAKAFNAWVEAKPERRTAWFAARPWLNKGGDNGRSEKEAR